MAKQSKHVIISFPLYQSRAMKWPETVRLTASEAKAMERLHLGGMAAMRTKNYLCHCKTVGALIDKGLLGKDGPTLLGREVARGCAELALESTLA
jgi:hypothetical protein